MYRKLFVLVTVFLLVLTPFSGVFAQGNLPPVYCGDLSAEDCAILEQAQGAMLATDSAAFDLAMNFAMDSDDPEMAGIEFSFAAAGAVEADSEILGSFTDPAAFDMANMAEFVPVLVEAIRSVKGNLELELTLPAELAVEAEMPFETLALDLVMVDGVLYVNLSELIPAEEGMPSWMGVDLAAMYEGISGMLEEDMTGEMVEGMAEMQELFSSDFMMRMNDPEVLKDFVLIERAEDAELAGQPMAVFNTSLNYDSLFSSEAFRQWFDQYMAAMTEMQGAEMEELPANFDEVMAAMMEGLTFEVSEWIGLDDFHTYHMDAAMTMNVDVEELVEIMGEEMGDAPSFFTMTFEMTMDMSAFNEPVDVVAPEGAQVINPLMMIPMDSMANG